MTPSFDEPVAEAAAVDVCGWTSRGFPAVPDFHVNRYRDRLHELIEDEGRFVAHSTRVLVDARKPQ